MRILIAESDVATSNKIKTSIAEDGYKIDIANNIEDCKYYVDVRNYDLVLLDNNIDNHKNFIATVKHKRMKTCIVITSEVGTKEAEIDALKSGAEDFLKKPLDMDILKARVTARLRHGGSNIIEFGELLIDPDEEKIQYQGKFVELKGKPFEVFTHLARHRDRIVSKEQLLDAIWEEPELVTPNVIEVAINQIRQKLDKYLGISTIETVRRRGYRFCYENDEEGI
ncbi:MAG: Transcriptional regulatory protein TcrA [uncultured Campylobacterales bacterium]|uniref:Transcriptional regulatory protein TcrA n=1 Tax=uncultured Campylobacterales bacterium TaxID=352960 RepID=A0A6S6TJN2_9BACT|nr:MAG: Transcriptional regulatory protein TcrA [uncultured Campylobacterales bacterium]